MSTLGSNFLIAVSLKILGKNLRFGLKMTFANFIISNFV